MKSKGVIISKNDGNVTVKVVRSGACSENCAQCNACQNTSVTVEAICDFPVEVGEFVIVSTKTPIVLLAMCLVFLFPLVVPLISYFLFDFIGVTFATVISFITFAVCLAIIYFLSKSKRFMSLLQPSVISVL